jgi:hypothetical protein
MPSLNAGISVNLIGGAAAASYLRRAAVRFPEITRQALLEAATETIVPAMQWELIAQESVYKGTLLRSIHVTSGASADGASIQIKADTPYASRVEFGGVHADVEFEEIVNWLGVKNGLEGELAQKVAAAIVDKLKTEGAEPHPFMAPGFEASKNEFMADVVSRIRSALLRA